MAGSGTTPLETLPPVGEPKSAPMAPSSGPIEAPAGAVVTVVVQRFWESATIRAYRNVVVGAIGAFGLYVAGQIITAGGAGVDWHATLRAGLNAGLVSAAMAYSAYVKKNDNNPVK